MGTKETWHPGRYAVWLFCSKSFTFILLQEALDSFACPVESKISITLPPPAAYSD